MAHDSDGAALVVALEEERMSGQIDAIAAFDEIVVELQEPPVASADAREIAAQLLALADTVRAGRDEQVRRGTPMAMTEDERDLIFELATALSGALVINYEQVNFRDSPIICSAPVCGDTGLMLRGPCRG